MQSHDLQSLHREYEQKKLLDQQITDTPMLLFQLWFDEFLATSPQELNMVLSTVDAQGLPDSRVVLLKGIEEESFLFYTNYNSKKGLQLKNTPYAALNFYWPEHERQIRIRGTVSYLSAAQSDEYFASRPRASQISTCISAQSQEVANREILENRYQEFLDAHPEGSITRPSNWGGFKVNAQEIEFWQGRASRLHDRILFKKEKEQWSYKRLEP